MTEDEQNPAPEETTEAPGENAVEPASRFPELDELQREIARRIRDNQRFLEGFMSDDFEEEESGDGPETEDFEEL